jgi:hypothetical protein
MSFIIDSQKNRKVEEILFTHNNENMQKTFKLVWSKNDYRKREIKMKNVGTFLTITLTLIFPFVFKEKSYKLIYIGALVMLKISSYLRLSCKMREYHRYEWDLHKAHMNKFAFFVFTSFLFIGI